MGQERKGRGEGDLGFGWDKGGREGEGVNFLFLMGQERGRGKKGEDRDVLVC